MKEITQNLEKYYQLFESFEPFNNFLKYATKYQKPQIFVDDEGSESNVVLYSEPAYFILGDPYQKMEGLFSSIKPNSWIIPSSDAWKEPIESYFQKQVETHERTQFHSNSLNINHVLQLRKKLPLGISIVPIEEKHLQSGMIYDDVISRFFTKADFLELGFGYALIDEDGDCEGFALTNYPIVGQKIELYFRVGYDSDTKYRSKGYGTTLCTYFIEEALRRGYDPVWDSANKTSAHIASKLGYVVQRSWHMFHVLH